MSSTHLAAVHRDVLMLDVQLCHEDLLGRREFSTKSSWIHFLFLLPVDQSELWSAAHLTHIHIVGPGMEKWDNSASLARRKICTFILTRWQIVLKVASEGRVDLRASSVPQPQL